MRRFDYFQRFYLWHNKKYNDDRLFGLACEFGHLEIAKWLKEICSSVGICINNTFDIEYIFCITCYNSHLKVAKWLKETFPQVKLGLFSHLVVHVGKNI